MTENIYRYVQSAQQNDNTHITLWQSRHRIQTVTLRYSSGIWVVATSWSR